MVDSTDNKRFYRYLVNNNGYFVGEAAYYFDEAVQNYMVSIIIAIDNSSVYMFLNNGFQEEFRINTSIMVKKVL